MCLRQRLRQRRGAQARKQTFLGLPGPGQGLRLRPSQWAGRLQKVPPRLRGRGRARLGSRGQEAEGLGRARPLRQRLFCLKCTAQSLVCTILPLRGGRPGRGLPKYVLVCLQGRQQLWSEGHSTGPAAAPQRQTPSPGAQTLPAAAQAAPLPARGARPLPDHCGGGRSSDACERKPQDVLVPGMNSPREALHLPSPRQDQGPQQHSLVLGKSLRQTREERLPVKVLDSRPALETQVVTQSPPNVVVNITDANLVPTRANKPKPWEQAAGTPGDPG